MMQVANDLLDQVGKVTTLANQVVCLEVIMRDDE